MEVAEKKKIKLATYFIYVSLGMLAFAVGFFLYWSFQPNDVLEIKNSPFPAEIIAREPPQQGILILKVDYCKKIDITGTVRMSFVSKTKEIFLPATPERGPVTCRKTDLPILIPDGLTPDTYKVHFRTTYTINPLQDQVIEDFYSKEFQLK